MVDGRCISDIALDCSARFFFAVISLARFAVSLGFLERPLVTGFLFGLISGEWSLAIHLAIFYELFWLDLFPAGTYIPPNAFASMVLTIGVAQYFGVQSASQLVVPMAIGLPAALLGAKVEYWQRKLQNAGYNKLIHWGRRAEVTDISGTAILRSLVQLFLLHLAFIAVCMLVLIGTINVISWYLGHLPVIPNIEWAHLWFAACIGGVLSLRVQRSYLVFIVFLMVAVLLGSI